MLKIHRQKNLRTFALASLGSAEVGDHVFALGSSLDPSLSDTFTQGNINHIDRKDGTIQHDAVIQGGNSGRPLL